MNLLHRFFSLLLFLMLLLSPTLFEAQSNGDMGSLLDFLKGDGAFETWFMEVFVQMDQDIESTALEASLLGRSIGGLGALIYLGYLGYQMQEGSRRWDVTPMLRPIIIGLVLLHWVGFYQLLQYPLQKLAEPSKQLFFSLEKEANLVRVTRFEKQNELLDLLIKHEAEEKAKEKELALAEDPGLGTRMIEGMSALFQPMEEWRIRMDFKLQKFASELIEALSLTFLRVATYLIFFIQKIWTYLLIVLGPVAVGLSLIPGLEGSFMGWISKFISVNLYTFVAYSIIGIGQQLIISGYHLELERYHQLIAPDGSVDMGMLSYFISNSGMVHCVLFPCVAYLVTGAGILMTPTIADSIVSAGSAEVVSGTRGEGSKLISNSKSRFTVMSQNAKTAGAYIKSQFKNR